MQQLSRGEGIMFEIDPSLPSPGAEEAEETFDREEVHEQLNYACTDVGGDSGSDTEDAVVSVILRPLSALPVVPGPRLEFQ